ncbi:MAG: stage II sporulation protein D [Clostridia bacterium]|nr:MAG: stage II sporulation protein D [Clostridia bacterium]
MARYLALAVLVIFLLVVVIPFLIVTLFPSQRQVPGEGSLKVLVSGTGQVEEIPLEEYVVGVVAAEMPAGFPLEALKAQAVAARTYALKRSGQGGSHHPGADLCTDPTHCQAWISAAEMKARWGWWGYWRYRRKIETAVASTRGLVLTYDRQLIDPVYHAACGGRTAAASEVWGYDLPYLQSASCPEESSPYQGIRQTFSPAELVRKLNLEAADLVPGGGASPVEVLELTPSGRARTVRIGSKNFSALQLRQLLKLNSTRLEVAGDGDRIVFTTWGYGHGVGLCQYGAREQALKGRDFSAILTYYYHGVKIEPYRQL